jgi:hypothetical protein
MFDMTTPRPHQCQQADPDNSVCQLEGKYTLQLNRYASRAPYRLVHPSFVLGPCSGDHCVRWLIHRHRVQPHGREMSKHGAQLLASFKLLAPSVGWSPEQTCASTLRFNLIRFGEVID